MPKARAMWTCATSESCDLTAGETRDFKDDYPVAVLPTRTKKQAASLVKWHNLPYEEKVCSVADAIRLANGTPETIAEWKRNPQLIPAGVYARAALAAMASKENISDMAAAVALAKEAPMPAQSILILASAVEMKTPNTRHEPRPTE